MNAAKGIWIWAETRAAIPYTLPLALAPCLTIAAELRVVEVSAPYQGRRIFPELINRSRSAGFALIEIEILIEISVVRRDQRRSMVLCRRQAAANRIIDRGGASIRVGGIPFQPDQHGADDYREKPEGAPRHGTG